MKKIIIFFLLIFFISLNSYSQNVVLSKRLQRKITNLKPTSKIRTLILLKDRIDILELDKKLYFENVNLIDRVNFVISQLKNKANLTQKSLIEYLQVQKESGKVKQYTSYWITNLIFVEATSDIITQLSRRSDIELMDLDDPLDYDRPVSSLKLAEKNSESVENGLKIINADKLWNIGITGKGRIVMNIDSGVDVDHPALNTKWKGNNGSPWYQAWYDPIEPVSTTPFDCDNTYSHGTHTMGIMCGSENGDTVGVAPEANWIAAGLTECSGASYPSMNISAYQWAMDPDSNSSTIEDMPDAINCSWQDPYVDDECTSIYVDVLSAVEASGIAVVFSAGNSGPLPLSITPPKNINTDSVNIFCVGNIDCTSSDYTISLGSSKGPSICGGQGTLLIKPEVSAPGTNIRSTIADGQYGYLSGTSMASPHVAGCIALLKQAAPSLTGRQLKAILLITCTDMGNIGEDNAYGRGLVDVYAAYQKLSEFTSIQNNSNNFISGYYLSNNYPNPFNPTTKISFGLANDGQVILKVYNLQGREVKTLINETKKAGNYEISINGENLASGVYFYNLKVNEFSNTRKMLLVK